MPSPTTALQLIRDGLGLTNAVGVDQTLTADETANGLRVLNDLVEDWSLQNLALWGQGNLTFNTAAGTAFYSIGTGGTWNTDRPVNIEQIAYTTISTATFPCVNMTQEEYNLIDIKTQQGIPERFIYINDFPLGFVRMWPVPSDVWPFSMSINRVLAQVPAAGTTLSFPPGYAKAFKYALAVELAPVFGKSISKYPDVLGIARDTFAHVKRANRKRFMLRTDPAFLGEAGYPWQQGY